MELLSHKPNRPIRAEPCCQAWTRPELKKKKKKKKLLNIQHISLIFPGSIAGNGGGGAYFWAGEFQQSMNTPSV